MLFLCTPGNPSGAVIPEADLHYLIEKALEHDVILISDECYSELHYDEEKPPVGLLRQRRATATRLSKLPGISQLVEAIKSARPALGIRCGRCRPHCSIQTLSHLPRLCDAAAPSVRKYCCMV